MTWGYLALAILILIAGVLAGYRLSWMDAYQKGRHDAWREAMFSDPNVSGRTERWTW